MIWKAALAAACLAVSAPAVAGPFEDGVAAYNRADYAAALRLWRPLAAQGLADAQYNLGLLYAKGQGVPQDYAEALKWWRLAQAQGYAGAQYNLGVMFANGQGVPQEYVLAHMLFNLAAAQGYADAAKRRDLVAARMTPAQIAEAQRLARDWRPTLAR